MTSLRKRLFCAPFVVLALASVPTLSTAQSDKLPAVDIFDGVWDTYGGISCRRGNAEPEMVRIKAGKVLGTIQTTDNANRMFGNVDAHGRMNVFVNGTFTLMVFKAVLIGNEGYGIAEATGDDVDCDGEWALKRRANAEIPDVHRTADGGTATIPPGFRSSAMSWSGQRKFREYYQVFRKRAEDHRIKSIMQSR